jgi:hypothetical protein
LIPTAEALGEDNHRLAEQILREVGSRIIEPSGRLGSGQVNDRSSIETTFVRLASHNKYLFPYTRQFYLDAGTLEIPDSATFWDLVAVHQDEGILAQSNQPINSTLTRSVSSYSAKSAAATPPGGKLERTRSVPLNQSVTLERASTIQGRGDKEEDHLRVRSPHTLFDRNRREMNERLSAVDDDDEKETDKRDIQRFSDDDEATPLQKTRGRRGLISAPHSPPPNVPLPSGPKPSQPQDPKKPIFLLSEAETRGGQGNPQQANTDDLREIFEKCSVAGSRVVELRSRSCPSPPDIPSQFVHSRAESCLWAFLHRAAQPIDRSDFHRLLSLPSPTDFLFSLPSSLFPPLRPGNNQKISWKQFLVSCLPVCLSRLLSLFSGRPQLPRAQGTQVDLSPQLSEAERPR